MAKGKKKKADGDFQKVKLKVGRKLKRDCNETKAEFKSRKIILKEIHGHTKDPITALSQHSEHISHHGKLTLLNHFNTALTASIVKSLNKPIIDSLSKFIIDHSETVRAASYKCLKACFNHMRNQRLPIKEFVYLLKPYLDCAFTHIDRTISQDCLKFLDYLTNTNVSQVIEPLISIVVRRFEAGHPSDGELNFAIKLKELHARDQKRQLAEAQEMSDKLDPIHWSPKNYILDLDCCLHNMHSRDVRQTMGDLEERNIRLMPRADIRTNSVAKLFELLEGKC